MDTRQKQKRQDEARQPAQTPIADAVVIGTAAGGLVLGTMQAQAAAPESDGDSLVQYAGKGFEQASQALAVTPVHQPPVKDLPLQPTDKVSLPAGPVPPVIESVTPAAEPASLADTSANPLQDHLVETLSQHMAGTIEKVLQGAEHGISPADFSQSISNDIVQSAQEIVARLDLGSLLSEPAELAGRVLTEVNPDALVAEVLGATSELSDHILTDTGALLGGTSAALAQLPSSLLGNDGADSPDGLLSSLFYSDGAGDGLAIPDLSGAASSVVADLGGGPTGLLGLSYLDVADHHMGHGLNALSLL